MKSPPQVHSICSADEMISDYDKLFENGFQDLDQLQSEFESAFGDSYAMMDPTLVDLVQAAHTSTLSGPDLTNRRDICSGEAFASAMRLDQIVSERRINPPSPLPPLTASSLARRSHLVSSRWFHEGRTHDTLTLNALHTLPSPSFVYEPALPQPLASASCAISHKFCLFRSCGDEAEEDASFAFTLESATFKLPLVRFSYE